jgi:hypothetical protein
MDLGDGMSDTRQHAHELIDQMPETQLSAAVGFLESIADPDKGTPRNAPLDDEPETEAERLAAAQARTSLQKNGGKGVPHNDAMRRPENGRGPTNGTQWNCWNAWAPTSSPPSFICWRP